MPNKMIFINGSPRSNGNTSAVAKVAAQAARHGKSEVVEIDATRLECKIYGCASCMKCHQSDEYSCVVGDQLAETVATLTEYDVIAITTPTYWMSYPAQLKMFIDRMGSLMKFGESGEVRTPLSGKLFAIIATGGSGLENNMTLLEQQWKSAARMFSCDFRSCLFTDMPVEDGGLNKELSVLKKAEIFGQQLAAY